MTGGEGRSGSSAASVTRYRETGRRCGRSGLACRPPIRRREVPSRISTAVGPALNGPAYMSCDHHTSAVRAPFQGCAISRLTLSDRLTNVVRPHYQCCTTALPMLYDRITMLYDRITNVVRSPDRCWTVTFCAGSTTQSYCTSSGLVWAISSSRRNHRGRRCFPAKGRCQLLSGRRAIGQRRCAKSVAYYPRLRWFPTAFDRWRIRVGELFASFARCGAQAHRVGKPI